MLRQYTGTNFPIAFDKVGSDMVLELNVEAAIRFYKTYGIVGVNYAADQFGIYSFATGMKGRNAKFSTFKQPKHLLRPFSNGCVWNPTSRTISKYQEVPMKAIQFHGEQCADLGDAWEALYAAGVNRHDLASTPQGKAVLDMIMTEVFNGLDNSFSDLLQAGDHPLIDLADAAGNYNATDEEWADFKSQQAAMGGLLTLMDANKAAGLPNYNIEIPASWFNGTTWVGDVTDFFRALKKAATIEQSTQIKAMRARNQGYGIFCVDSTTFQAYKERLIDTYNGILQGYQLEVYGIDGIKIPLEGALYFDGDYVVDMAEWESLGQITNNTIIRGAYITPGVFGVPLDVDTIPQGENIGMIVNTKTLPPYMGITYMQANFRMGAAILDDNHITHGSVVYPNA